jgi:hypothetical protein
MCTRLLEPTPELNERIGIEILLAEGLIVWNAHAPGSLARGCDVKAARELKSNAR